MPVRATRKAAVKAKTKSSRKTTPKKTGAAAPRTVEKPDPLARITIAIPASVVELARDVVFWSPGETLAGLITAAIEVEVAKREKKRGEPFPKRRGRLRAGRPISA